MKPKITDNAIGHAIRQLKKGRSAQAMANGLAMMQRHIQRLWAEYLMIGKMHVRRPVGRHTDWHIMKDPRMKGLNLITYLDDALWCVTGRSSS
jgi:hypothetical protein